MIILNTIIDEKTSIATIILPFCTEISINGIKVKLGHDTKVITHKDNIPYILGKDGPGSMKYPSCSKSE